MKNRLFKIVLAVIVAVGGYLGLFKLAGDDALSRFGYILWLHASTEDRLNFIRGLIISNYFRFVMPVLVGLVALGWAIRRTRKGRR